MPHLTSTTARTFDVHGVRFTSYASSASGAREVCAWRADFPAHTPGHHHRPSHEEVLLVLSGSLEVEVDDERFTAVPGDAVIVPAGARFRVSTGGEPAQAWVTTSVGMRATVESSGEVLTPPWAA